MCVPTHVDIKQHILFVSNDTFKGGFVHLVSHVLSQHATRAWSDISTPMSVFFLILPRDNRRLANTTDILFVLFFYSFFLCCALFCWTLAGCPSCLAQEKNCFKLVEVAGTQLTPAFAVQPPRGNISKSDPIKVQYYVKLTGIKLFSELYGNTVTLPIRLCTVYMNSR